MDLVKVFTYQPPTEGQKGQYAKIRDAALVFAQVLKTETPEGPDQTVAIRKVREAMMTANASIATDNEAGKR